MFPPLVFVLVTAAIQQASSHGSLVYPPSRSWQAFEAGLYHCPSCGNGAGKIPSIAGDPFQDIANRTDFKPFSKRFYAATVLKQGQTINVKINIATNHGGRLSVSVCPKPRKEASQACFDVKANHLRRVDSKPSYNNKFYYYLKPTDNGPFMTLKYKLPPGVSCINGCTLQWKYIGYQTCTMPCESSRDDVRGECGKNPLQPNAEPCRSGQQPELFLNLADVIITPPGKKANVRKPRVNFKAPRNPVAGVANKCPDGNAQCKACKAAAKSSAAKSLVGACYKCDKPTCATCLGISNKKDVMLSCLGSIASGVEAWKVTDQCAAGAKTGLQMNMCTACLTDPGVPAWGCMYCIEQSGGDSYKMQGCLACVRKGVGADLCAQCLYKKFYPAIDECLTCLKPNSSPQRCFVY